MSARLRRPRLLRPLLLAAGVYAGLAAVAPVAEAAVMGRNGLEIQGPNDRRGFYVGVGLGFGASYFDSPFFARTYKDATAFIPAGRLELSLGGGVGKRLTLGGTLHLGTYFSGRFGGARAFFGGDVEANIFIVRGFFIRTGIGISGVPRGDGRGILMGAGGLAGVGYEFWLNTTAALGVSAIYDIRAVPGDGIRHTPYVGLRFSWY
jgi:hypothetical protein